MLFCWQVCCKDLWYLEVEKPPAPGRVSLVKAGTHALEVNWNASPASQTYILQIQKYDIPPTTTANTTNTPALTNTKAETPSSPVTTAVKAVQPVVSAVQAAPPAVIQAATPVVAASPVTLPVVAAASAAVTPAKATPVRVQTTTVEQATPQTPNTQTVRFTTPINTQIVRGKNIFLFKVPGIFPRIKLHECPRNKVP